MLFFFSCGFLFCLARERERKNENFLRGGGQDKMNWVLEKKKQMNHGKEQIVFLKWKKWIGNDCAQRQFKQFLILNLHTKSAHYTLNVHTQHLHSHPHLITTKLWSRSYATEIQKKMTVWFVDFNKISTIIDVMRWNMLFSWLQIDGTTWEWQKLNRIS